MSQVELVATNLHWLPELDPSQDLCAHGDVILRIDGQLVGEETSLCVSAAAMNLLRSLTRDHTQENPIDELLFPHCGFTWIPTEEYGLINISSGCGHGLDLEIRHRSEKVVITSRDGAKTIFSKSEWAKAVYAFADGVEAFYERSDPKDLSFDDDGWFELFWEEWHRHRSKSG